MLATGAAAAGVSMLAIRRVTAQESAAFACLGLTELDITVLAEGFEGAPTVDTDLGV